MPIRLAAVPPPHAPWMLFLICFRACQMSFPFGFQLLCVFSFLGPPWGGAHSLRVYYVRSLCLHPESFPPNSTSSLTAFLGGRRHVEIWKVLKQPAGGGDRGKVGGREGQVKSGGWGRKETEYKQDTPRASALHPIQPPSLQDHSPKSFSTFLLCFSKLPF